MKNYECVGKDCNCGFFHLGRKFITAEEKERRRQDVLNWNYIKGRPERFKFNKFGLIDK